MQAPLEQLQALHGLAFAKMNGSGNDFILVDNRVARLATSIMPDLARGACARGRSVGADGLIILEPSDRVDPALGRVDWRWHFFNADGSSAEMCGNGGRCAARFAVDQGLAGPRMVFDTLAGPIRAWVEGSVVKLEMVPPKGAYRDLCLEAQHGSVILHGVNTGVPHAVVPVEDLQAAPVKDMGRALRFHRHFAPVGTNVNFICVQDGELKVRTYERGVEDETLACGTGAVASALVAGSQGWLKPPVTVRVKSGETLKVHFSAGEDGFREVLLEGAASYVYQGVLHREAFQWLAY
ncbi:MAG: diaminopimelate epimerase [Pseudomonadota bacterium]